MITFEKWLMGNNDRVFEEHNVNPDELLYYLEGLDEGRIDYNFESLEAGLFFMMGAKQDFEEMNRIQKIRYIYRIMAAYEKEYKEVIRDNKSLNREWRKTSSGCLIINFERKKE